MGAWTPSSNGPLREARGFPLSRRRRRLRRLGEAALVVAVVLVMIGAALGLYVAGCVVIAIAFGVLRP